MELSAKQVADAAGISVSQLNRIETEDIKRLPEETLKAIELAMGVSFGVGIEQDEGGGSHD